MRYLPILVVWGWMVACGQPTDRPSAPPVPDEGAEKAQAQSAEAGAPAPAALDLRAPTVIILHLDSLETEQLLAQEGGDELFEAADDLFYYEAILCERLDSLGVPVFITDQDSVAVQAGGQVTTLLKDTAVALSSYYYFDGQQVRPAELWQLLEQWQMP